MKRRTLVASFAVFVTVVAALLISSQTVLVSAQNHGHGKGDRDEPPPFYNPYPPGILPSDLNSEIARVLREVDFIENEALMQLRALPPPTLTGQPPILAHTGQRANVLLGKVMNFDKHISPFKDMACGFCHMPYAAFSGSIPSVNLTMIAYPGSFKFRAGKRTAQRYTLCTEFPCSQSQRHPECLLWRKLLGFTGDRLLARES
jgi:cytochrome c peroxidase